MAGDKKSKSVLNGKKIVPLIILFAIIVIFYMSTSDDSRVKNDNEYTILKEKDLVNSYPETPREVVKLYGRLVKCIYKKNVSDEKVETLVIQMRNLFDQELLDKNSLEEQLQDLEYEKKSIHNKGEKIINYEVEPESLVTGKVHGRESATVVLSFSIKKGKNYSRTDELFLLRQDSKDKWKIVGWQSENSKTDSKQKKSA